MTDANLTEIVCVLDRSGSMAVILDDAIGGFNTLLRDQQDVKEGRATMTIALFDHEYQVIAENTPVERIKPFDNHSYVPRGSTALLDAVGSTIERTGARLAALPEDKRPGKVLFVILTDGQENASQRYNHDQVASMIKHQTEQYGWTFMYLSADVNAFNDASRLHIPTSVHFSSTALGTQSTYSVASTAARQYRKGGACGMSIMGSSVSVNDQGEVKVESGETDTSGAA